MLSQKQIFKFFFSPFSSSPWKRWTVEGPSWLSAAPWFRLTTRSSSTSGYREAAASSSRNTSQRSRQTARPSSRPAPSSGQPWSLRTRFPEFWTEKKMKSVSFFPPSFNNVFLSFIFYCILIFAENKKVFWKKKFNWAGKCLLNVYLQLFLSFWKINLNYKIFIIVAHHFKHK